MHVVLWQRPLAHKIHFRADKVDLAGKAEIRIIGKLYERYETNCCSAGDSANTQVPFGLITAHLLKKGRKKEKIKTRDKLLYEK